MIAPVETFLHIIISFIIFIVGLFLAVNTTRKIASNRKIAIGLYLWHTLFAILYMYYTLTSGGDSLAYYVEALSGDIEFNFGTEFVKYFASLLISYFNVSYLGLFLFFNIFGSIGLIIFHASLSSATLYCSKRVKQLTLFTIFLPSVSFWSSALGKDSIAFLSVTLFLWAALNIPKRKILMAIAIMLMLLVRPHIASIMVLFLCLSMIIIGKQISMINRFLIVTLVIPIAIVLIPFAANYAGVENFDDLNELNEYIEKRQGYNMEGGGGIDISGMSPVMQIFTYLFRPLPYEAHSFFSFMASLDNLFLLILFIYAIGFTKIVFNTSVNHFFLWVYVIGTTFVLATTTANLGISVRQKWMIMPILLYLLFTGIAAHQAKRQRRKQRKAYAVIPRRLFLR